MTTTAAQAAGATPEKTGTNREPRPFEHRHPHFVKLLPLLTRYRAVMGGMETTEERKAYLPKFPHELDDLYDHRVETTEFLGSSETAVERLTGAVFASPPQLSSTLEQVNRWISDTDGQGTDLRDVLEVASGAANAETIHFALVYPTGPSLEELELEEGQEPSQADVEEAGGRGVAIELIEAACVPSWGKDADGRVVWCAIQEFVRVAVSPFEDSERIERWRVVTLNEIVTFEGVVDDGEDEAAELREVERVAHNLGRLLVVPVYGRKVREFEGVAFIKGSTRADISKLREDSWGQQIRNVHGCPILVLESARKMTDIWVGSAALRLEPGEKAYYLNNDGSMAASRNEAADRFGREAMRLTGSNPSFTAEGLTFRGESGVAQRERFTHTEQRFISRHTRDLARAAREIIHLATMILEDLESDQVDGETITASFFNVFDVMTLEELARVYQATELSIDSPTYHRVVRRTLARGVAYAATPQEMAQIEKEINAAELEAGNPENGDDESDSGEEDPRRADGA